jgi:transcriptional regulator
MYIPKQFKIEDWAEIEGFVRQHSFGLLVSTQGAKPVASHIPIELEQNKLGKMVLRGHLARANPQWQTFENNAEVLVIFQGNHTYISSSWYEKENVPTWNYTAVHIYGSIRILNEDELKTSLKNLVDKYEVNSENPVRVEELSAKNFDSQLRAIIGFEVSIGNIEAKYKLSQNRNDKDYKNIIQELEKCPHENAHAVAQKMKEIRSI